MKHRVALVVSLAVLAWCTSGYAADSAPDAGRFDSYQARKSIPAQVRQVAADLYFFYEDAGSNSAFLVTDDGVLVIDTRQHPVLGRDLIARIRKVTDKPIKWVVVTHAHGDHYYGNPAFKAEGATIIAHKDTMAGMIKNESIEFRRRQSFFKAQKFDPEEVKTILPDVTFDSGLTLTLGGRKVEILYWGPGQNPGDTIVYFPHARALYVGGPFARKNWSNMSFTPSVDGWIALLNRVAAMDVDTFLPGHGDVSTKQDVLDEAKLLADVQSEVKAAIARGMTREQIVKELRFPQYASLRNYDRIDAFLEALHHLFTTGKPMFPYP